jgi:hypothetical protein
MEISRPDGVLPQPVPDTLADSHDEGATITSRVSHNGVVIHNPSLADRGVSESHVICDTQQTTAGSFWNLRKSSGLTGQGI